jgi:hypothetical protein
MELSIANLESIIALAKEVGGDKINLVFWNVEASMSKYDVDYQFNRIDSVELDGVVDIKTMIEKNTTNHLTPPVLYIGLI